MSDLRAAPDAAHDIRSFEQSLPMALMRAREAVMRKFRPSLAAHDLTEQQWRVLRALADSPAPIAVGELADATYLLGPSLSRMLVALTDRGLVARSVDTDDARRSRLSITSAGRRLVSTIAPHSEMVYDDITAQLGSNDLDLLYDLLRRTAALSDDASEAT